jgi:hypothetical protein
MEIMYTNITKIDTTNTIVNKLKINSGFNENTQNEIVHILKTVMEQNNFQFEKKYYKQSD